MQKRLMTDDAAGLPMLAHPMPTPSAAPPRKASKGFMKPGASIGCTCSQHDDECISCAYQSATGCPHNFPVRCEEEPIRCRNKLPATFPLCISLKCAVHCKKPDCLRHHGQYKGTENKKRRRRTERPWVTLRHPCLEMA